jgi:hypothetical protein
VETKELIENIENTIKYKPSNAKFFIDLAILKELIKLNGMLNEGLNNTKKHYSNTGEN